MVHGVGFEPT